MRYSYDSYYEYDANFQYLLFFPLRFALLTVQYVPGSRGYIAFFSHHLPNPASLERESISDSSLLVHRNKYLYFRRERNDRIY